MAYSRSISVPTANTLGGVTPPIGTTGRFLFEDSRIWRSNQVSDEAFYPGQVIILRETVQLFYEIYDDRLIKSILGYYEPKYYLGTWQVLRRQSSPRVQREGKSRYLVTTLEEDNVFTAGYKLEDGVTDYGLFKIQQCNFSLQPQNPISIEIGGVGVDFARYTIPPSSGTVMRGSYGIDRAYPRNDRQFQLELGKIGLFTYPGASLTQVDYFVRQIHNLPGEAYPYQTPGCPLT